MVNQQYQLVDEKPQFSPISFFTYAKVQNQSLSAIPVPVENLAPHGNDMKSL